MEQHKSRRQFLKGLIGGLGAAVATHLGGVFPEGRFVQAQDPRSVAQEQVEEGNLYAGFVLLAAIDSPHPSFVECAPAPILHGSQLLPAKAGSLEGRVKLA